MTKRYDIEGCTGHCYGGYRMVESPDGDYVKAEDFAAVQAQRDRLEAELERERIRLAACGVAAMANTLDSAVAAGISRESQYWSASYGDVVTAVEREMRLRLQRDALLEAMQNTAANLRSLAAAGNHRQFDTWLQVVEAAIALCEVKP